MAVDRGGLRYQIQVENAFSAELGRFKSDLRTVRTEWDKSKRSFERSFNIGRGLVTGFDNFTKAIEDAEQALASRIGISTKFQRALDNEKKALDDAAEAVKHLTQEIAKQGDVLKGNTALNEYAQAIRDIAKNAPKAAKAAAQIAIEVLKLQQGASSVKALGDEIRRTTISAKQLQSTLAFIGKSGPLTPLADVAGSLKGASARLKAAGIESLQSVPSNNPFGLTIGDISRTNLAIERAFAELNRRTDFAQFRQRSVGPFNAQAQEDRLQRIRQHYSEFLEVSDRVTDRQNAVGRSAEEAAKKGEKLSFTYRRLIGIFAAFQATRIAVNGIRSLISDTIDFERRLESTRLGVASLFTAVGQVKDPTGKLATGAHALNEALKISDDQLKKLRVESVKTAATFDQLAETFQVGLAPGLEAGLDINQVRKFAIQVSQAASAIGLQQSQLAEEIRSILQGTIQARTTRLAVSLGITNEDIRRAKEAGTLFELLQKKFNAFSVASERAINTFDARLTNAKDALLLVSSSGGLEFFRDLKGLLREIQEASVQFKGDDFVVNPKLVALAHEFFQVMDAVVEEAGRLGRSLSIDETLQIASVAAAALREAIQVAGAGIEGLFRGVSDVSTVVGLIAGYFSSFLGDEGVAGADSSFKNMVRLLTEVAALSFAIRNAWVATLAIFGSTVLAAAAAAAAIKTAAEASVRQAEKQTGVKPTTFKEQLDLTLLEFESGLKVVFAKVQYYAVVGLRSAIYALLNQTAVFVNFIKNNLPGGSSIPDLQANSTELAKGLQADKELLNRRLNVIATKNSRELALLKLRVKIRNAATDALKRTNKEEQNGITDLIAKLPETGLAPLFERISQEAENLGLKLGFDHEAFSRDVRDAAEEGLGEVKPQPKPAVAAVFAEDPDLAPLLEENKAAALRAVLAARNDLQQVELENSRLAVVQAENELVLLEEKHTVLLKNLEAEQELLALNGAAVSDLLVVGEKIENQKILGDAEIDQAKVKLAQVEQQAEIARRKIEEPITFGLQVAIDNLDTSAFESTVSFIQSAIQQLSATISQAILDAFLNPEADIRETFGNLFRSLAQQLLQILIQALVVKAIAGVAGAAGGGQVQADGTFAAARGGRVPRRGRASLAHYGLRAEGFAAGGRPPGIAASDTVPAWLTPGEWVMRLRAVQLYGSGVMAKINAGLVDPFALKALAGTGGPGPSYSPSGGYAEGGTVSAPAAQAPGVPLAVVESSPRTFSALLAGERGTMIRWLRDNKAQVNSALAR